VTCARSAAISAISHASITFPSRRWAITAWSIRKLRPDPSTPGEARRHRAGHHYAGHLDIAVDHDLPHVVAKVGQCGKRLIPDCFLVVDVACGEAKRRVDGYVPMKQLIESVQITRITRSEPSKHHRLARVEHDLKVALPSGTSIPSTKRQTGGAEVARLPLLAGLPLSSRA